MDFVIIPPYNLWYAMENGLFQEVRGKIVSGFWQPKEMKFYAYLPIKENKFDWFEIQQDLAVNINWNKVIDLIEKRIAAHELEEKQMRKMPQLLQTLGVLNIEQVPQTIINGQPVGTVEKIVVNQEYMMHYSNPIEAEIGIIDITDSTKKEDEKC